MDVCKNTRERRMAGVWEEERKRLYIYVFVLKRGLKKSHFKNVHHEHIIVMCVPSVCSSGQVVVMEMNIERRSKAERVRQTADHLNTVVTAMVWDSASSSLFVGDSTGKVTHINIPTSKVRQLCVCLWVYWGEGSCFPLLSFVVFCLTTFYARVFLSFLFFCSFKIFFKDYVFCIC